MRLINRLIAQAREHREHITPIGVAVLIAFAVLLVWLLIGRNQSDTPATAETLPTASRTAAPTRASPSPSPTATVTVTPSPLEAAGATPGAGASHESEGPAAETGMRMVIPAIGVDAPVTMRKMGSDGVMGAPNGRFDVVWYDFSAWPGMGGSPGSSGNAIFSGHVDYHPNYEAVFWDLRQIGAGDIIEVHLPGGSLARYSVQWSQTIGGGADFGPFAQDTGESTITVVTCQGTFNSATREYSSRLIVRGVLLP